MRKIKLTREEKAIESAIQEYAPVGRGEFEEIARAIALKKKDAVMNIRLNKHDLDNIKKKAKHLGVKYQTFVSEILHKVAQA
ncbi:MAG: antitoxin [Candidatus Omnitrophica bacterium]|nr:antitoxin [Candidatus Omnitrophota bacterium]